MSASFDYRFRLYLGINRYHGGVRTSRQTHRHTAAITNSDNVANGNCHRNSNQHINTYGYPDHYCYQHRHSNRYAHQYSHCYHYANAHSHTLAYG